MSRRAPIIALRAQLVAAGLALVKVNPPGQALRGGRRQAGQDRPNGRRHARPHRRSVYGGVVILPRKPQQAWAARTLAACSDMNCF